MHRLVVYLLFSAMLLSAVVCGILFIRPIQAQTKTVTCPADGKFHIVQAVICDPEGKPFLPRGINDFAGTTFGGFNENIANEQVANTYVNGWKFNILRIVTCPNGRCYHHEGFGGQTVQGDDLDTLINVYTAKKVVIMLDHHGLAYPNAPSAAEVAEASNWFKQMAVKYKNNPYVWLESFNEPVDGNDKIQQWAGFSGQIIDAVRSVNQDVIVVINSGNFGQDTTGNGGSFDPGGSHILNAGPALAARGNVAFDIHFYSRWQAVNAAGVKAYFAAVHNAGMAIMVGETWGDPNGADFMRGDQMATNALYAARPNGVGIMPWSAAGNYPGTTAGRTTAINSLTNPTNLTHNGQLHWDWTHNPPSAVPDGYTVTTGGGPNPTTGPACPKKAQGDADCNGSISIVDYAEWRAEFKGGCVTANQTANTCGVDRDSNGTLMDADFNGDNKVTLVDFQIWRATFTAV